MEWILDPPTALYTLTMGTCAATVWLSTRHGYAAKVVHRGMATAQYGFETLENAQAWCLTKLAELRVAGRCGSNDGASDTDEAGGAVTERETPPEGRPQMNWKQDGT